MKNINYLQLAIVLFSGLLLTYCTSPSSSKKENGNVVNKSKNDYNLNISILLDLSDRISQTKNPDNYKNDLGHISSVAEAFIQHVKVKKNRLMDDQMQIYFEPVPDDTQINSITQKLKIKLTKDNATKEFINNIKPDYSRFSSEIYSLVLNNNQFLGSDIWGFFNSRAQDYCVKADSRNILVILTDGYIYHKNKALLDGNKSSYITPTLINNFGLNKSDFASRFKSGGYGFLPVNKDLSKLNVIVLGVKASNNNPYDEDLINLYWSTWFKEMGIKNFKIISSDLPSNLDPVIKDYILNKAG